MRSSTKFDFEPTLTISEGQKSKIKLKPTNEPNKGLRFLIAPTANIKDLNSITASKQIEDAARKIIPANIKRHEVWIVCIKRVIPAITYPFALTRFTNNQLKRLATTIEKVILPKMGINQNTPKAVVYGPHELGEWRFQPWKQYKPRKK